MRLLFRNTWVLGYNMGKADLTNLFIEGQKVSLEAVNITVDDRKKYPGEQKFENCLKINHENTMHRYKLMVENCLKKMMIRFAVPIQASSHSCVDEQVQAEKRHRQDCSRVGSRQQLVKISSLPDFFFFFSYITRHQQ